MENKINIAELLKDCPKGMELDCTMFDNVTFVSVNNNRKQFPIEIAVGGLHSKYLTKEGCFHDTTLLPEAKCVIFPKGKTTWKGFVPLVEFKDGDILVSISGSIFIYAPTTLPSHCGSYAALDNRVVFHHYYETFLKDCCRLATKEEKQKLFRAIKDNGYKWNAETKTLEKLPIFNDGDIIYNRFHKVIGIYHSKEDESPCVSHCRYNEFHKTFEILNEDLHITKQDYRLASNDEKQKFFDVIKAHGYKWNPETRSLEKLPMFKVGDKVRHKTYPAFIYTITNITKDKYECGKSFVFKITNQNDYELVPNKFDITTLVPFKSRVLVRDTEEEKWKPAIWGYYDDNNTKYYPYETVGGNCFQLCIPYDKNEHLLSTTNDCDDFYKTWES